MRQYESIIVVGPSGAGKTTLVNGLRKHELATTLVVPKRYVTRPLRLNDDLTENKHVSTAAFWKGTIHGDIWPYWRREFEEGRDEQYGFSVPAAFHRRLRVYSANNAFLRDKNPSVQRVLDSGLVVVIMSTKDARTQCLTERSPDMTEGERELRLADDCQDIVDWDGPNRVIDTTTLTPKEGQAAFQQIVHEVI